MKRSEEITRQYFTFLDKHIYDVVSGAVPEFLELNEIAGELAISHKHLTDTVKKETGKHPCSFYDEKIIDQMKQMLTNSDKSVAEIARIFTYDPSNFSKFFKKMTGFTPGNFRNSTKV
ncbi:AraC family transcriptional regulator [uncultured Chryseobacterium sp.]|uniref:helix-turn-helix domain-containing protein n=1 Tax=uncultured Chryseobacterium sp. TaxID=259322 RepID=UPI002584BF74|nr:AraC family transcriptional regulator [uncultured Chryseobacterium sp.]